MKKNIFMAMAISSLVASATFATENLVKNGDFSSKEQWKLSAGKLIEEDGNSFVKLSNDQGVGTKRISQVIKFTPTKRYLIVGLKVRLNEFDATSTTAKDGEVPRVMVVFSGGGEKTYRPSVSLVTTTNGEFIEMYEELEIPKTTIDTIELVVDVVNRQADFDVDDISLVETDFISYPVSGIKTAGSFDYQKRLIQTVPLNWNLANRSQSKYIKFIEEDGRNFLQIKNSDPKLSVTLKQNFDLNSDWKKIKVSVDMKAENLVCGEKNYQDARVMYTFLDEAGKLVGGYGAVPSTREDTDWKNFVSTRDIPEGAKYINIAAGLFNATGTLNLDNIMIEEAE